MNALIARKSAAMLPLWLAFILISSLILAPSAQAIRYLSDGSDRDTEGDPLDANDFSSGGDGLIGDIIENSFGVIDSGGGDVVIVVPVRNAVVYLVVDFQDGIPVLHAIKVPGAALLVEEFDAR